MLRIWRSKTGISIASKCGKPQFRRLRFQGDISMTSASFLWMWLLGAPLIGAIFELMRTPKPIRRMEYGSGNANTAAGARPAANAGTRTGT
jgi:hypothetical protein